MNNATKAFTLMELMVVVTIVGIVAGFAIPNYTKSVEKSYGKDATNNLLLMKAAMGLSAARNNGLYPSAMGTNAPLSTINSVLGLNIIANTGLTYTCTVPVNGASFGCNAVHAGHTWELNVTNSFATVFCVPQPEQCP